MQCNWMGDRMIKKIKNITIAEIRRICEVHLCHECPLYKKDEELEEDRVCLLDVPDFIPDWMLEEKVEVPDEVFGISDQLEEEK